MNKLLCFRIAAGFVFALAACSVASAQETAVLDVPAEIKAGESLSFTIRLNPPPSIDGGFVSFTAQGPNTGFSTSTSPFKAGQTECRVTIQIPAASAGGKWRLHLNGFFNGAEMLPLQSKDITFEVTANERLVFPTSAEVRLNPSQVQLLRSAARSLQFQVQNFKAALTLDSSHGATAAKLIRGNIETALESLKTTQSEFRKYADANTDTVAEQVFFDDLRLSYEAALARQRKSEFRPALSGAANSASLVQVAQSGKPAVGYAIEAEAALRPFEQNELAYNIVAETESLTFDLKVGSNPTGAEICYHRRGDDCHVNSEPTNTVLKSLPYAIWLVQFKMTGYKSQEIEHDPFRESNHVINVDLRR